MNIGDVSARLGLPAKTIRYYEDIGLIKPLRSANGYRSFVAADVHRLAFLGRARALGFTIEDCRILMALYKDESRASADVKDLAKDHLCKIEAKIHAKYGYARELIQAAVVKFQTDEKFLKRLQEITQEQQEFLKTNGM